MTQQDDITQRVLTDDEIEALAKKHIAPHADRLDAILPTRVPYQQTEQFRRVKGLIVDVLSKLRAPVADESTIRRELVAASNYIDTLGGDSRSYRAALASAPVAGEAQKPVATLDVIYPGCIEYTLTEAAQSLPVGKHACYAAPQASAEDVRNAALEEAAVLVGGHIWAGASKIVSDLIAEHIRALKTQADKDGGQQRAGDSKTREAVDYPRGGALNFDDPAPNIDLEAAAKTMAECMDFPWEWMPERGRDQMRLHAQSVIRAATKTEQGERD